MSESPEGSSSDIKGVAVMTFVVLLGIASLCAFVGGVLSVVAGMDLVPEENRTKAIVVGLAGSVFWLGSLIGYIRKRQS